MSTSPPAPTAPALQGSSNFRDYLLTNRLYRRCPLVEVPGPAHVMDVLWQVQQAFLDAAFKTIETDFGGLPRYLEGPMGLGPRELDRMRERLLEA